MTYKTKKVLTDIERFLNNKNFKNYKLIPFNSGDKQNYLVKTENETYFLKYHEDPTNAKCLIMPILDKFFERDSVITKYRVGVNNESPMRRANLEAKVLTNWEREGINSVRVKDYEGRILVVDYIPGCTYNELINQGDYKKKHHTKLLDSIISLREKAVKKKNKYLLHNDLHLGNMLFDPEDKIAKPIDPGLEFKENLNFEELDAYINLFFIHSLLGNYLVETKRADITHKLLDDYIKQLTPETKDLMHELNHKSSLSLLLCGRIGRFSGNYKFKRIGELFKKENYNSIQERLKSRV